MEGMINKMKRRWVWKLRVSWSIWAAVRIWRYINVLLDYTIWINNVYKQIIYIRLYFVHIQVQMNCIWCFFRNPGGVVCCGIPLRRSKRLLNSMLVGELSPGKMFFFLWSCSASFRGLGGLLHSLRLNARRYNIPFTPSRRFWDLSTAIEDRRQPRLGLNTVASPHSLRPFRMWGQLYR